MLNNFNLEKQLLGYFYMKRIFYTAIAKPKEFL